MLTATIDLFLVFNATFSNISAIAWRPVLVVAEATRVPKENHITVKYCIMIYMDFCMCKYLYIF
jgi:hypothetical protein